MDKISGKMGHFIFIKFNCTKLPDSGCIYDVSALVAMHAFPPKVVVCVLSDAVKTILMFWYRPGMSELIRDDFPTPLCPEKRFTLPDNSASKSSALPIPLRV